MHNQDVANHESGDLGHFVFNYRHVWSDPTTRPHASILHKMYDWQAYYKKADMRVLSGLTKTAYDEYAVRGFCASRGKDEVVDLKYKMDPATESGWRGADGCVGSAGFPILPRASTGVPLEVMGKKGLVKQKFANEIRNLAIVLEPFGLMAAADANYQAAATGRIPVEQVELETPDGQWGPLCKTGSKADCQGSVRLLERVWWPHPAETKPTIWALPENTKERATSLKYHFSGDKALVDGRPLAYVRYADQKVEEAPIYNHPNSEERRALEPVRLAYFVRALHGDKND